MTKPVPLDRKFFSFINTKLKMLILMDLSIKSYQDLSLGLIVSLFCPVAGWNGLSKILQFFSCVNNMNFAWLHYLYSLERVVQFLSWFFPRSSVQFNFNSSQGENRHKPLLKPISCKQVSSTWFLSRKNKRHKNIRTFEVLVNHEPVKKAVKHVEHWVSKRRDLAVTAPAMREKNGCFYSDWNWNWHWLWPA